MNKNISIIISTFNSDKTIHDTFESLLNQSYLDFECIVVDGDSKDATVEIIKSFANKFYQKDIPYYYLSEPDEGIADAWNKGLKKVAGNIIVFLNSDDWLHIDSLEKISKAHRDNLPKITYGICNRVNDNKEIVHKIKGRFFPQRVYLNFGFSFTTCSISSNIFQRVGEFDKTVKIAIDTDFLLRALKKQIKFEACDNQTFMRLGGVSNTFLAQAESEYYNALARHGFNPILIAIGKVFKAGIRFFKLVKK